MNEAKKDFKLSPPWQTYRNKMAALFDGDKDIRVFDVYECKNQGITEGSDYAFDIEVKNHEKYLALEQVMPKFKMFGHIKIAILLYDLDSVKKITAEIFQTIFKDNPHVKGFRSCTDILDGKHYYCLFKPEVVQFPNDDSSDWNGNFTGLYQDIAREIFENCTCGMNFCTSDGADNDDE